MNDTTLGMFRAAFDNSAPEQLRGLSEERRAMYLRYTYASKAIPGVRYVRSDRWVRDFPQPGLHIEAKLDRDAAHALAEAFISRVWGENARRLNNHSLDVSLTNVVAL